MANDSNETVEINGFVLISDYDRRGNIVELMIETEYLDKYIITPDVISRKLLPFLNRKLRLRGIVTGENVRGKKVIRVKSYKLLNL